MQALASSGVDTAQTPPPGSVTLAHVVVSTIRKRASPLIIFP